MPEDRFKLLFAVARGVSLLGSPRRNGRAILAWLATAASIIAFCALLASANLVGWVLWSGADAGLERGLDSWLGITFFLPLGLLVVTSSFVAAEGIAWSISWIASKVARKAGLDLAGFIKRRERLFALVTVIALGGLLLLGSLAIGYHDAQKEPKQVDAKDIVTRVSGEQARIGRLSGKAKEILGRLDEQTEAFNSARQAIEGTLKAFQAQSQELEGIQTEVVNLQQASTEMMQRAGVIQTLLEGERPISVRDLTTAQRTGWLQGIVGSLLVAFVLWLGKNTLGRWFTRGGAPPPGGDPSPPSRNRGR